MNECKPVFIKEIDKGYLVLVDSDGATLGWQSSTVIAQGVDEPTAVTVTFSLNPATQMYKEKKDS